MKESSVAITVETRKPKLAPRLVVRPSDGVIEARDGGGHLIAHYNPRSNETRDTQGILIGKGNRLLAVLKARGVA